MSLIKNTLLLFLSIHSLALANINHYLHQIHNNPQALYAFFKEMPKGGELHYHLAGGVYPEAMLALGADQKYCLNKVTLTISKNKTNCQNIPVDFLNKYPELYQQTIRAWSLKDFIEGKESAYDHFFAAFYKFAPIIASHHPALLAEIMQRAVEQHELYLEIMIMPDNGISTNLAGAPLHIADLHQRHKLLLANPAFCKNVTASINTVAQFQQETREYLRCKQHPQAAACRLTIKFQYHVLREQSLEKVFAQALHGFLVAQKSKHLIAVNLVQAENNFISLRDYRQQMQIFNFLHHQYPKVHISLHAGELAPAIFTAKQNRFHIYDAVMIGHAQRIGHGVDIHYENKIEPLLQYMKKHQIAVEINLTSNEKILGVSGKSHPLGFYLKHQIPVVFSTDDEGILRTDLSAQYVEAVLHYNLDYSTIKQINRNTLTFSFLPGKSLWLDAWNGVLIKDCQNLNSQACTNFINKNEKAKLQHQLEIQLLAFEKKINAITPSLN